MEKPNEMKDVDRTKLIDGFTTDHIANSRRDRLRRLATLRDDSKDSTIRPIEVIPSNVTGDFLPPLTESEDGPELNS